MMQLESCNNCGIVVDLNKIKIPDAVNELCECDASTTDYIDGEFLVYIRCPLCGKHIHIRQPNYE